MCAYRVTVDTGGTFSDFVYLDESTGELSIWNMGGTNGTTVEHNGPVTFNGSVANPGPGWKAIGTGNFTGGLFSDDILLQNHTTGQVSVWDMGGTNGTSVVGSAAIGNPGLSWRAAGSDGLGGDILLQNTGSGQTSIWAVHDLTLTSHGPVSGNLGPSSMAVSLTHFT